MSKNKNKGKKDQLEGFDIEKEKEILKKLEKATKEDDEDEDSGKPKKNMFSNDLFKKAQEQPKKNKKKEKAKPEKEVKSAKNKRDEVEIEEEFEDEDARYYDDEEEEEIEGLVKEQKNQDIATNKKDLKKKGKKDKSPTTKQDKGAKGEKGEKPKEKKDTVWNVGLSITLFLFTAALLFSKYQEENFSRAARLGDREHMDDPYELLEVDSSATPNDIKKQFKKLAVAWHPDRNPGCGKPCDEKFSKIHKAYEILSDEEKRANYDNGAGIYSPIKSKTVSLTMNNYKRLVEESNDIWIIQVYEDGEHWSMSIADIWDNVAKSYGGTIKFGRVNSRGQQKLLNYLPYKISIFPTILAIVPGQYPDIFTFSRPFEHGLRKFIDANIIDYVNRYNAKDFTEKWSDINKNRISSTQRKPEIVSVSNSDSTPIFFKYGAFKLNELYDFYHNSFGEGNKVRKAAGKSVLDFVVDVDHLKDEKKEEKFSRDRYHFQLNQAKKETIKDLFGKVQEFVKFNTVPELDKHLYAEFCGGMEGSTTATEASNIEEDAKPSICVLLLKESKNKFFQDHVYELQKYQKAKSHELYLNIQDGKRLYENYNQIRFGIIDLDRQTKFKRIVQQFAKVNNHEFPGAIALIHETGKYFMIEKDEDVADFVQQVENESDQLETYYAGSILDGRHLNEFLYSKGENTFTILWKSFKSNLTDLKMLGTLALIFVLNQFVLKNKFGASVVNAVILYIATSLILGIWMTYQEFY